MSDPSPPQRLALKTAALADPAASVYVSSADDAALAAWLNTIQPTYYVWRTALTPQLARSAIVQGASQLDALTVGKRDSLLWLVSDTLDPQDTSVRIAIDDLCGTQATLKAALQSALKRPATRAEKILASGGGTSAAPSLLGWEGLFDAALASMVRVAD